MFSNRNSNTFLFVFFLCFFPPSVVDFLIRLMAFVIFLKEKKKNKEGRKNVNVLTCIFRLFLKQWYTIIFFSTNVKN